MRALVSTIAAAALAATAIVSSELPAFAKSDLRPRVQPGDCTQLSAKLGRSKVWQAFFWATFPGDEFRPPAMIDVAPCFASYNDCFNWLYWAQTDWDARYQNLVKFCKPGMPYS